MKLRHPNAVFVAFLLALLALLPYSSASGQEVVVQNDSVTDFSQAFIQAGFVASEKAAAWLTSPCQGNIVRVQILWLSLFGGAPPSLEAAIDIFEAGVFPDPGASLVTLLGPQMIDGALNEFDLPVPAAVQENQTFVVSFTFFNTPPATGPSVVNDTDSCQAGKNGIFIPGPGWFNSCVLGVSGDFVIRAVVDCGEVLDMIFSDGFESGDTSA